MVLWILEWSTSLALEMPVMLSAMLDGSVGTSGEGFRYHEAGLALRDLYSMRL